MKKNFALVILAVMFSLSWLQIAHGQKATTGLIRLHTMAEKGDATAQYELAEEYRIGFSIQRDHKKALDLYKRSAEQGYASSQFRLGELYEKGEVIERDLRKAVKLYRKAAEQGHIGGQYALAYLYHVGTSVERDIAAAIVWYRKAARQGDEWSQLALGDQYRLGVDIPRDLVQSTKWYRMAAQQGNIFAQYEVGNAYRSGKGVEPNIVQAIEWYRLSAEKGNPFARHALDELEADGIEAERVAPLAAALDVLRVSNADRHTDDLGVDPKFSESPVPTVGDGLAFAAAQSHHNDILVSRLLALAEAQMAKLALTTPEGDNAYETYLRIQSLQPNNQAAMEGIEQVGVKYVELSELAAEKGKLELAKDYAAKAAILAPQHPVVLSMTFRPLKQRN